MSSISSTLANLLNDYKKAAALGEAPAQTSPSKATSEASVGEHGNAYVLDLSQAAQDILDKKSSNSTINLSDAQKAKLTEILDKYKDAPVNGDTLAALDADLKRAGLAPDQLAIIQEAKDFNPVQELIKALTSVDDSANSSSTQSAISGLGSSSSLSELLAKYEQTNQATSSDTLAKALNSNITT